MLSGRGLDAGERTRRITGLLARVGLERLAQRRPGELSGGEQQRLALARALIRQPAWLILDEPLAHLDGVARDQAITLLREVLAARSAGAILATHEPTEIMGFADQLALLVDGRLVQTGTPAQVYRRPVNLAAARLLGPAWCLVGQADGGAIVRDGTVLIDGLPPSWSGACRIILRPHEARFVPDPAGAASVLRCEPAGPNWKLTIQVADSTVLVDHDCLLPSMARGRLRSAGPAPHMMV
jgi:iron(III) transport system ATP-binding protein